MKILVINAGSSSLKYQVIDMTDESMLCKGVVERIGFPGSMLEHKIGEKKYKITEKMGNHTDALRFMLDILTSEEYGVIKDVSEIEAVGHRVLISGEDYDSSVLIDEKVIEICKKNYIYGPLHMPANTSCMIACREIMPNTPMAAVFDNTFHSSMPQKAFMYAIPYEDYQNYKLRRYGFHGTSHKYVSAEAIKYLAKQKTKIITCHLGNGSSMSAVVDGKCVDTTMGLTPLEGLIMGTRSGDIDPTVIDFMVKQKGISMDEALNTLNKKSGFLGVCGVNDFRDVVHMAEGGNKRAKLCLEMFQYRIKKYIGSYFAIMGGLDLIVFTGGIGENAHQGRQLIMEGLEHMGVEFDFDYNQIAAKGEFAELHKPTSKVKVLVIPTNEELVIARDTMQLIKNK